MSGLIYRPFLFVFVRVGLIPHSTYHAGDVARRGVLDPVDASISRVDLTRRSHAPWTTGSKIKHVSILKRYNGPDQISRETSGPSDQKSRGAIGAFL